MKILYPNEARLKNLTYGCDVYIDVDVEYSLFNEQTGKYIYQNGDVYEGDWLDDKCHGFGTFTTIDGSKFEGNWENDKKEGFGKESYSDGSCFEG